MPALEEKKQDGTGRDENQGKNANGSARDESHGIISSHGHARPGWPNRKDRSWRMGTALQDLGGILMGANYRGG